MKELIKLTNITFEIQDTTIFENVNANVRQGEIIGVIGKNGAGKSTLLQLLNNELMPAKGNIQWLTDSLKIVMVEQESEEFSSEDKSLMEVKLLEKWHVPADDFSHLSGGEKLKARLANGFSKDVDILLLDEPTNHLDELSIELLIGQMKGTIIFVSHDRYFLDAVATKIWSLEGKTLIEHNGNYSNYAEARKKKRLSQEREFEKQQKMIERIEGQMRELTSWSKEAHTQSTKKEGFKEYYRVKAKRMDSQVKSKQKRLKTELENNKVEPVEPEYTVHFSITSAGKQGKRFLEAKNVTKAFADRLLFRNVSFTIQHGEKVAITGPNGSGKTTLLKILLGLEDAEGEVWTSPSANIGYLTQEVFDLPMQQTPEQLFYRDTYKERGKVQTLMKHLGFTAAQWKESIGDMSMGERVKCKLMLYILEEKDVLVLDEPTNHLDLQTREQLEEIFSHYNGTLLVVSHDRYFLEKTTTCKLIISDSTVKKQLNESPVNRDDLEELLLKLETERQEVLGKLSFLTPKTAAYADLDKRFLELTKQINEENKKRT